MSVTTSVSEHLDHPPAERSALVHAAGGVLWRRGRFGTPEVALIHRPRYDDWSLPKGKAKRGEHLLVTALREVEEETGFTPRLGPFLARFRYSPSRRAGRSSSAGKDVVARKDVSYWSMAMTSGAGAFAANDEVDDLAWLPVEAAAQWVTYPLDRKVLGAFATLPRHTSPVVVVRGGHSSSGADPVTRPLDPRGWDEADRLVPVLTGAGVQALRSAPYARCVQTLQNFSLRAQVAVEYDQDLVEGMIGEERLDQAAHRLLTLAADGVGVAACVNGPLVSPLLAALTGRAGGVAPVEQVLRKGGWWLLHVAGERLVSLERHVPAA